MDIPGNAIPKWLLFCGTYIEDITWPSRDKKFLFQCWKIFQTFFPLEKRNFVSPSCHVMFYLLYKHQWSTKPCNFFFGCERCDLSCCNSNGDIFTCEENMLFSHVKISCVRAKAHRIFHWCLYNKLWYVTLGARGFFLSYFLIVCGVKLVLSLSLHCFIAVSSLGKG